MVTFGSLFSGIGGFDLGFERAGMTCAYQVEIDPQCREVLANHFPDAQRFEDVKHVGKHNLPTVDVIAGGFPCQDISEAAGSKGGTGLQGERSGLWSQFYRIICETKPRFVVVENVPALLSVNNGRDFGRILSDLAGVGYDAEWRVLSSGYFGASHLRKRLFLVAYPHTIKSICPQILTREWIESRQQRERDSPPLHSPRLGRTFAGIPSDLRVPNGLPYRMDFTVGAIGNAVDVRITELIGECLLRALEND